MQIAQVLLTDEQALQTRLAIDLILQDPERFVMTEEETDTYKRLAVFFGVIAAEPSRFPPRGAAARTVKSMVRRARGPAQPQSRRKLRSQGQQKRDRAARRRDAEAYNVAVARVEQDMAEAEELQRELIERFESETKFTITDAVGNVILDGVPESMIRPTEEPDPATVSVTGGGIGNTEGFFLPGSHEKAMQREANPDLIPAYERWPDGAPT